MSTVWLAWDNSAPHDEGSPELMGVFTTEAAARAALEQSPAPTLGNHQQIAQIEEVPLWDTVPAKFLRPIYYRTNGDR